MTTFSISKLFDLVKKNRFPVYSAVSITISSQIIAEKHPNHIPEVRKGITGGQAGLVSTCKCHQIRGWEKKGDEGSCRWGWQTKSDKEQYNNTWSYVLEKAPITWLGHLATSWASPHQARITNSNHHSSLANLHLLSRYGVSLCLCWDYSSFSASSWGLPRTLQDIYISVRSVLTPASIHVLF